MVTLVMCDDGNNQKQEHLMNELNSMKVIYQIGFNIYDYGITRPFLVIDGVPLDYARSLKWIDSYKNRQGYDFS